MDQMLARSLLLQALALVAARAGMAQVDPRSPRQVVAAATRAVEVDSVRQAARRWAAAPASDREASLGLATLARLTYRWDEADRRYRLLLPASGPPADPVQVQAALDSPPGSPPA